MVKTQRVSPLVGAGEVQMIQDKTTAEVQCKSIRYSILRPGENRVIVSDATTTKEEEMIEINRRLSGHYDVQCGCAMCRTDGKHW